MGKISRDKKRTCFEKPAGSIAFTALWLARTGPALPPSHISLKGNAYKSWACDIVGARCRYVVNVSVHKKIKTAIWTLILPKILLRSYAVNLAVKDWQAHDTSIAILAEIVKPKLSRRDVQSEKLPRLQGKQICRKKENAPGKRIHCGTCQRTRQFLKTHRL